MSSQDRSPKYRSREPQSSRKKTTSARVERNPHISSIATSSSSSSTDDTRQLKNGNSKVAKSKPTARSRHPKAKSKLTEGRGVDRDLREMTTSNFVSDTETGTIEAKTANIEQETVLDVESEQEKKSLLRDTVDELSISATKRCHDSSSDGDQTVQVSSEASLHASTLEKIQRMTKSFTPDANAEQVILYHDDEEINQAPKTSSDSDEYLESGAALTVDESSESTFVVYPLGCCEFDETQLVSATSTKAIQKCILRLSNKPKKEETFCWGLDQSQAILMRLHEDYIQFTDLKSRSLLRSQPIHAIKTWAVDDDNNFAFVVEDAAPHVTSRSDYYESVDYALLNEPSMVCYIFRSIDDDDMSCRVATKLNQEISRYKEQMSYRISKSTRMQQMIEPSESRPGDATDAEELDELEASNELTMRVKYIGKTSVPRPVGIDVLNVAIDKCLADASKLQASRMAASQPDKPQEDVIGNCRLNSGLVEAKLHVLPSSVIVENESSGEILVECRIRYLTFMGISRRDIRWCGFIMQNTTNKSFEAHCFECQPTAGHVCEAIQASCSRMYERVFKTARQNESASVLPTGATTTRHLIRDTLARTLSRIKLNPIR